MSSRSTPPDSNPRKRRRLNNNLATSDRMQVMAGIEKRKVEKLKQELSEAMIAKDNALKELGQIKSDTICEIQNKNKEINNVQTKLQILYHENQQSKQRENTLTHKIEIIQSQIDSLQKENFNLRAKLYNNNSTCTKSKNNVNTIQNGHKPMANNKNSEIECMKLKKEIEIYNVTITSQNEEIIRLETQIKEMENNNKQFEDSLSKASKHIDTLQQQLNEKTKNQSNLAKSEMEDISQSYERKIRLLSSSLDDYKKERLKLVIISEEYELNKNKYSELKRKYVLLQELNTKYEPVYNELNEWKNIIREMCSNMNGKCVENEYELKICLKEINEKYILIIKERDEYKSNMLLIKNKLKDCNKQFVNIKIENENNIKLKDDLVSKMDEINKELFEYKNECKSYKNIMNTYNAMSPSKTNQQKQINKLYQENHKLNGKINELNEKINRLNKIIETISNENMKLKQNDNALNVLNINNDSLNVNTKILNMKNNPLQLAMDKKRNKAKEKIIFYEEKIKDLESKFNKINKNQNQNQNQNKNNDTNDNNEMDLRVSEKYYELENKYNILIKKHSFLCEEILNLKKEFASSKKINERMKTLFGKKAGEYRERIYQMTGYNICLLGDGKHYRLQHLWMNNQNDEIILQINKLGQLQLKDTDFIRNKIDKALLNKLKKTRSLPIFLSKLTLCLYKDSSD